MKTNKKATVLTWLRFSVGKSLSHLVKKSVFSVARPAQIKNEVWDECDQDTEFTEFKIERIMTSWNWETPFSNTYSSHFRYEFFFKF